MEIITFLSDTGTITDIELVEKQQRCPKGNCPRIPSPATPLATHWINASLNNRPLNQRTERRIFKPYSSVGWNLLFRARREECLAFKGCTGRTKLATAENQRKKETDVGGEPNPAHNMSERSVIWND